MAYVPPTVAEFKARYPEFAVVGDTLIGLVLEEAKADTDDTWLTDADRKRATMLLTAHRLKMEGYPERSEEGGGGVIVTPGSIKRDKVGDVETEFNVSGGGSGGGSSDGGDYALTVYGRDYWLLVRQNFGGPRTVMPVGGLCPRLW